MAEGEDWRGRVLGVRVATDIDGWESYENKDINKEAEEMVSGISEHIFLSYFWNFLL